MNVTHGLSLKVILALKGFTVAISVSTWMGGPPRKAGHPSPFAGMDLKL